MGEKWFEFVKRIHKEGQAKNPKYAFKEAMSDASKRKSEWKKDGSPIVKNTSENETSPSVKRKTKSKKSKKSKKTKKNGKSRKHLKK